MGLFGAIGSALGTVAGVAGNIIPGPGGFVLRQVGGALRGGGRGSAPTQPVAAQPQVPTFGNPGGSGSFVGGGVGKRFGPQMQLPAGAGVPSAAASVSGGACTTPGGLRGRWTVKNGAPHCKAIRRVDPLNRKALRRGRRRSNRFVDIAKEELKANGLKVSRSGTGRRRDLAPGHTHVR